KGGGRTNPGKPEQSGEPRCRSYVDRNAVTQKTADECQQPKLARRDPALACIAVKAFAMPACHEVSRTRGSGGLDQKLSIRAYSLKPMMLDNDWLARKKAE